jgi:hypothetical protein
MCPEPIRDYVGEALARSLNGKAASVGTDSGGNDAMSPANRVGFNGGGFSPKLRRPPNNARAEANRSSPHRRPLSRNGDGALLRRSNCKQ